MAPAQGVILKDLRLREVVVNNLQWMHSRPPPALGTRVCGPASVLELMRRGRRAARGPISGQCRRDQAIDMASWRRAAWTSATSSSARGWGAESAAPRRQRRAICLAKASTRAFPDQFWRLANPSSSAAWRDRWALIFMKDMPPLELSCPRRRFTVRHKSASAQREERNRHGTPSMVGSKAYLQSPR